MIKKMPAELHRWPVIIKQKSTTVSNLRRWPGAFIKSRSSCSSSQLCFLLPPLCEFVLLIKCIFFFFREDTCELSLWCDGRKSQNLNCDTHTHTHTHTHLWELSDSRCSSVLLHKMWNSQRSDETNEKQLQHWETDSVERQRIAFIERDTKKWDLGLWALEG